MNDFGNAGAEFIEFGCPQCSTRLKVAGAMAGKPAKCPKCAGVTEVPSESESVPANPPPPSPTPNPTAGITPNPGLIPPANSTPPSPAQVVAPEVVSATSASRQPEIGAETETRKLYRRITEEVAKVFVGQDELVQGTLIALFSGGHVLIESVPGLGKTLFVRTLGKILGCQFGRIQFTADLMPSDITGAPIFNMKTQEFEFRPGPVFTQLLLADEINRSPAKTHAALLETMQEKRVTVDGVTHELALPFLVLATQNPIESEGTYNLPEAQLDRFMLKLSADYPSEKQEAEILIKHGGQEDVHHQLEQDVETITSPEEISRITRENGDVRIDPLLVNYINRIVRLTARVATVLYGRFAACRDQFDARVPHTGCVLRPGLCGPRRRCPDRNSSPSPSGSVDRRSRSRRSGC